MKLSLRRRYTLAFLSLAVSVVAVFTALLAVELSRQDERMHTAGLTAATTALRILSEERARTFAALTTGALQNALTTGDKAAIASRAAELRRQAAYSHLDVFARDGSLLYADGSDPGEGTNPVGSRIGAALATGETDVWEDGGTLQVISPVHDSQAILGAVYLALPLDSETQGLLSRIDRELSAAAHQDAPEHVVAVGLGIAGVVVFSIVLAFWHARDLSKPIEQLGQLTSRYARGDYGADVPFRRDDEIGALAEAMRRMAHSLRETTVSREELQRTIEEVLRTSRRKTEFLANMSHELRTPLNAIIGFAHMMRSETLGPIGNRRYREYAGDIQLSATQMLEMVNDILDSAKFESGRLELREEEIDLRDMVDSMLRLFAERASRTDLQLRTDLPPDLPLLRADRRMLRQILTNLVSNAVKFTPAGGNVTVRGAVDRDGLVLAISDTGIGMAAEDIPKALTPYVQLDSAPNREHVGTGLGLPLVKSLVELHGGTLRIDSTVGSGSTINVIFPMTRVVARTETAQTSLPLWAAE